MKSVVRSVVRDVVQSIGSIGGIGGGIPNKSDLNFWAKDRTGLIIPDDFGHDINILPACFRGNGSTYYSGAANILSSDDWTVEIDIIANNIVSTTAFFAQGSSTYLRCNTTDSRWHLQVYDGTHDRSIAILFTTLPLENRMYHFKVTHAKTGNTRIYESGNLISFVSGTFTNVPSNSFLIGYRGADIITNTCYITMAKIYSDITQTNLVAHWKFIGSSTKEYDITGNAKDLSVISYATTAKAFHTLASTYYLDNGWSLWQKTGSAEVIVPYGASTTSLVTAGYGSSQTYSGNITGINMAPCVIGFNESSSVESELEIYDRSNITRQTVLSRASAYYDATNLATKSRYYIDEISNYGIRKDYFNVNYQGLVHVKLSGINSNLSIVEFFTYTSQKSTSQINRINGYKRVVQALTVGTGKDATYINASIRIAFDGCVITIDAATYNETLNLTWKELNFVGLGSLTTIISYEVNSASAVSTIQLNTNSTFNNIVLDKSGVAYSSTYPILTITTCNPTFTNCYIRHNPYTAIIVKPMTITGGSIVTMINCSINTVSEDNTLLVADTSRFYFTGTTFKCKLLLQDTAIAVINTDEMWGASPGVIGMRAEDNSELYITVNTTQKDCNGSGIELAAGNYSSLQFAIYDNAKLQVSGKQIIGITAIYGDGNTVLFKDIVSTFGGFKCVTVGAASANTTEITFDNCQIVMDLDDDVDGWHIIEEVRGATVRLINNTVLEFSGHNGNWYTMGNPVTLYGGLFYMRNSTVIDNCNDNIPFGANYRAAVRDALNIDIENSTITNQNSDGVGTNACISLYKFVGTHITVNLKNVVLNNSEIGRSVIYQGANITYDSNDYIHIDNVTKNSTGLWFDDSNGGGNTAWSYLTGN
jgi:hypothetical protein